jgi:hypothetical protein
VMLISGGVGSERRVVFAEWVGVLLEVLLNPSRVSGLAGWCWLMDGSVMGARIAGTDLAARSVARGILELALRARWGVVRGWEACRDCVIDCRRVWAACAASSSSALVRSLVVVMW